MQDNKRTTVNLEIPKDIKDSLVAIAESKEMSLSGLIRLILKEYLKSEKL